MIYRIVGNELYKIKKTKSIMHHEKKVMQILLECVETSTASMCPGGRRGCKYLDDEGIAAAVGRRK